MTRRRVGTLKARTQTHYSKGTGVLIEIQAGDREGYSNLHVVLVRERVGVVFKFDAVGRFVGEYEDTDEQAHAGAKRVPQRDKDVPYVDPQTSQRDPSGFAWTPSNNPPVPKNIPAPSFPSNNLFPKAEILNPKGKFSPDDFTTEEYIEYMRNGTLPDRLKDR